MDFYDSFEDVKTLIKQVFELNPHSVHTLNKHKEGIYGLALDNINIVYAMDDIKKEIHILKVIYADNSQPRAKLRTKEWLATVTEMIDFKVPSSISGGEDEEESKAAASHIEEEKKDG